MHEVRYFDDNVIAVENARRAGFCTFGVKDLQSAEELETVKKHAHAFIETFENTSEDFFMESKRIIPTAEDIARVKGLGFLRDKTTEDCFNARVITRGGKVPAKVLETVAEAARLFGSGEVALTTRMSFEVQRIPYVNIEPFCAYLAEHRLATGGTGPRVRPIVSCKGTTCQYGLIDTFALAEKLHERFYEGYHSVKLPHKFKIGVGGCPNNCVKPDLNDIGIIGQRIPAVDACKCRSCKICQIEKACSIKLARIIDGKIYIDPDRCNHCGRCVGKCPFGAVEAQLTGYCVTVGGRWGKQVARGRALDYICTSEDEVLALVEKCILLFRDKGEAGERFADTIARLGFEKVQALLASDSLLLRKDEILADKA
ncbi:MAG: 4Fe-4S binding protein [Clostridia bacterium]|nr:4Fe-4S binding protein [Clostridia bacterium]